MRSKKWVYLLTGLMHPTKVVYPHTEPVLAESIEEINLQNIGIRLKRVFLAEKDRIRKVHIQYEYKDRFVFYINDGIRDDNLAQSFADAVTSSLALLADLATEEIPTAIGIPEDSVKKGRIIRIKDILGSERTGTELYFRVMHCVGVSSDVLEEVWRVVPVIMKNKSLMDATYFYRESITQVWVAQDDVLDMIYNNSDISTSMAERARIETAYQNAYKAIEAIIGEPPKDERKLRAKLLQAGINPDEKVGYELHGMRPRKETVLEKLINMQQTRDKKVAHGKTSTERVIGYCELKDKQELARYVLLTYINSIISDKNYVS
jgi:hypothetical protein